MSKVQIETIKRIYDERFPDHYLEIGTDADTGQAVEIRSVYLSGDLPVVQQRIAFDPEAIPFIIDALQHFQKV
jgi:hypothetical protein